jgi:hypothetical protein
MTGPFNWVAQPEVLFHLQSFSPPAFAELSDNRSELNTPTPGERSSLVLPSARGVVALVTTIPSPLMGHKFTRLTTGLGSGS